MGFIAFFNGLLTKQVFFGWAQLHQPWR